MICKNPIYRFDYYVFDSRTSRYGRRMFPGTGRNYLNLAL